MPMVEPILLLAMSTGAADRFPARITTRRNLSRRCVVVLLAAGAHVSPLVGQPTRYKYEFAGGVAVPTGILGRTGGAGPLVRASISQTLDTAGVRFRFDLEATRIASISAPPTAPYSGYGLEAYSVVGNLLLGPDGAGIAPFGLVGLGLQFAASQTPDSYPGVLMGVRLGLGLRGGLGRYRLSLEVAAQGAVFSIFGPVGSYRVGAYWPITLGLAF